jgi:hypothetical protein
VINFDRHRNRHEQVTTEFGDESRGEPMGALATIEGRDERARIGDNLQRASKISRR